MRRTTTIGAARSVVLALAVSLAGCVLGDEFRIAPACVCAPGETRWTRQCSDGTPSAGVVCRANCLSWVEEVWGCSAPGGGGGTGGYAGEGGTAGYANAAGAGGTAGGAAGAGAASDAAPDTSAAGSSGAGGQAGAGTGSGGSAGTAGQDAGGGTGGGGTGGGGAGGTAGQGGGGAAAQGGAGGSVPGDAGLSFPTILKGIWLIGWSGGLNHYSWARFACAAADCWSGTVDIRSGADLYTNMPFWPCDGQGQWMVTAKPNTVDITMPAACADAGFQAFTFETFTPAAGWPKGAVVVSTVSWLNGPMSLDGYKFPDSQCDAAMTACTDPLK